MLCPYVPSLGGKNGKGVEPPGSNIHSPVPNRVSIPVTGDSQQSGYHSSGDAGASPSAVLYPSTRVLWPSTHPTDPEGPLSDCYLLQTRMKRKIF